MSVLSDLADYVIHAEAGQLSHPQRTKLQNHVSDCAIALVAGAGSPEGLELGTIMDRSSKTDQIAGATAIIRSTEVDDIHLGSCTTPSSVAVPAALLLNDDSSATDVENAALVCIETMVRLGLAIDGPSVLYKGIWPTAFAAPLAVAALAARLWKLDQTRTVHALSLALMMSAGRTSRFAGTPSGRWIIIKSAVAAGLDAARAARAGYKGDPALLDGDWMERSHGFAITSEFMRPVAGQSIALQGLCLKPFSTARQALGPTQALMELIHDGLSITAVQSITVRVPPAYAGMISQPVNPEVRGTGYVSAAFQMALAALKPMHLWDLDRSSVMHDSEILALTSKIRVEPSEELRAFYPACWPAEIEVVTAQGVTKRRIIDARGDPSQPLSNEERETKTRNLLDPIMGKQKAAAVWQTASKAFDNDEAMKKLGMLANIAIAGG